MTREQRVINVFERFASELDWDVDWCGSQGDSRLYSAKLGNDRAELEVRIFVENFYCADTISYIGKISGVGVSIDLTPEQAERIWCAQEERDTVDRFLEQFEGVGGSPYRSSGV